MSIRLELSIRLQRYGISKVGFSQKDKKENTFHSLKIEIPPKKGGKKETRSTSKRQRRVEDM